MRRQRYRFAPHSAAALISLLGAAGNACAHNDGRRLTIETRIHGEPAERLTPVVQELHDEPITGLAIDPSGSLVVTAAGADVRLWELPGGRLRARVDNLDGPIRDLAFFWRDPSAVGEFWQLSVLYTDDEGLKHWSLETDDIESLDKDLTAFAVGSAGQLAASQPSAVLLGAGELQFHSWPVKNTFHLLDVARWTPCAGCPPADRIVAIGADSRLFFMDPHRNEGHVPDLEWLDPCDAGLSHAPPQRIAVSNDGRRVAFARSGQIIASQIDRLSLRPTWREPELRPLRSACLETHVAARPAAVRLDVAALQFDADSDLVSIAGADGSARTWNLKTGAMTVLVAGTPGAPEQALAAHSATRRWLAHASGGEVRVHDLRGGAPVAKFPVVGPRRRVVEVDLSARGQLAVAREDRVEVWDLASGRLQCLDALASRAAWSPGGGRLAAWERQRGQSTATPRVIVRSAEEVNEGTALTLSNATFPLPPIVWVNEQQLLVPIGPSLEVWDVDAGIRLSRIVLPQANAVHSLALGQDRVAALKHNDGNDTLFSLGLADPSQLRATPVVTTSGPVAVAPDGAQIATVHGESPTIVWDAQGLRPKTFYWLRADPWPADIVAFSPRGLIRGDHHGMSVRLRIPGEDDATSTIETRRRPLGLDVSTDGRSIAVAAADGAYVHRLGDAPVPALQLVSDVSSGCDGLVIVGGSRIATSRRPIAPMPVRLGSPLSGPLVPANNLPAAFQVDAALLTNGARRSDPPGPSGTPTLRFAALRSRHLLVSLTPAGDGPVVLCLEIVLTGRTTLERCFDAKRDSSGSASIALPADRIADVWVRACDPTQSLCGRAMRAVGPHTAVDRRHGF